MQIYSILIPPNTSGQLVPPTQSNQRIGIVPNGTGEAIPARLWYITMPPLVKGKGKLTVYDANNVEELQTVVFVVVALPLENKYRLIVPFDRGVYVVTEECYAEITVEFREAEQEPEGIRLTTTINTTEPGSLPPGVRVGIADGCEIHYS